jgi:hypothetical protein
LHDRVEDLIGVVKGSGSGPLADHIGFQNVDLVRIAEEYAPQVLK